MQHDPEIGKLQDHDPRALTGFALLAEREGDADTARVFRAAAAEIKRLEVESVAYYCAVLNVVEEYPGFDWHDYPEGMDPVEFEDFLREDLREAWASSERGAKLVDDLAVVSSPEAKDLLLYMQGKLEEARRWGHAECESFDLEDLNLLVAGLRTVVGA